MGWKGISRQRATDIAGFVFFGALAVAFFIRMPRMAFLLLPMLAKELFMAFTFLIRERPVAAIGSWPARVAAYAGTFLMVGLFHALRTWRPETFTMNEVPQVSALGGISWIAGTLLVLWAIWSLRYAFSIEPQARHVVRSGAYKFVRHPVYAAYTLQYLGIWLIYPSTLLGVGIVVWFAMTLTRMRYEEMVLEQAFPEYESYKRTTGALFPVPFAFRAARGVTARV